MRYAGLAILCFSFIFLGLFFVHFLTSNPSPEPTANLFDTKISIKFFTGFPTLITSYALQSAFFTAYASLKKKTNKNGLLADIYGRLVVFVVYITSPLIAYGLYGDNIEKNLLKSVTEETGVMPVILEVTFILVPAMGIPTIFFVGKEAILIIFDEITRGSYSKQNKLLTKHQNTKKELQANREANEISINEEKSEEDNNEQNNHEKEDKISEENGNRKNEEKNPTVDAKVNPKEYLNMKPVYYYIVTLSCYFIVVLLSIVVGDVSIFFGLIGSTTGSFVLWIGPGSFYVIAVHKENYTLKT